MKNRLIAVGASLAVGLGSLFWIDPAAQAVKVGVEVANSSASDYTMMFCYGNTGCFLVAPGQSRIVSPTSQDVYVTVRGDSFRVRYDANSGSYQGCQNISASGAKTFIPSNTPDARIDILNYRNDNCTH